MKEVIRLKEMSVGLKRGAANAGHLVDNLTMIILNLKIQAAYIDVSEQKTSTLFTIEKLTTEINQLREDIKKVGMIGSRIGELDFNTEDYSNLIEELELIEAELKDESKITFKFLEKLRYICLNLEIQATHMGNSPEARAISVIVKALVHEISILQKSALMVEGSSNEINKIVTVFKEQSQDKPKVKTKQ